MTAWRCAAAALVWTAGCAGAAQDPSTGQGRPVAEVPAQAPPSGTAAVDLDPSNPHAPLRDPGVELGEALRLERISPGHYSMLTDYHQMSSCSRSYSHYHARTSLVLDLRLDGVASACRGKAEDHIGGSWSGSDPPETTRMREQQGFVGTWSRDGAWIDVTLELAHEPCPQQRGWVNREPKRWKLRCLAVLPKAHPTLPRPALICQIHKAPSEALGYQISDVLSGEWMILGGGKGLVVQQSDEPFGGPELSIRPASEAIRFDAWSKPLPKLPGGR